MKRITANIAFLTLFLAGNTICFGQDTDSSAGQPYRKQFSKRVKETGIVTGINWQGNWKDEVRTLRYAEIGIAKSIHDYGMHGPVSFGIYASEEIYFGDKNIYGTKLGVYTHYLFDVGFSMIYYTDFKKGNFKFRPEIGLGLGPLRIVTGFNIPFIDNSAFKQLQKNNAQISIQFFVPVKKKQIKSEGSIIKDLFKK